MIPELREDTNMGQTDKIDILVRDVYGRGHGKEATIQRIMDVIGLNREAATIAFIASIVKQVL